jgi:glycerophosphoryl diester phosphodiesterase
MTKQHYAVLSQLARQRRRPFLLAHRGARARAPENSRAAFELALTDGADALETDLQLTRDGVMVCIHDGTVDRTTDGTRPVDSFTWEEIRRLRLRGNNEAQYPNEHMLSLDELLEAFAPRVPLALELKAPSFAETATAQQLLATLQQHRALDRVIALSFHEEMLDCLVAAGAPFPVGLIIALRPWPARRYPLLGHWWPNLIVNPLIVPICRRRGQVYCPLDPLPEPRLRCYLWLGVDGVLSDDPRTTIAALERLGAR